MTRGVHVLILAILAGAPSTFAQVELRSRERLDAPVLDATLAGVRVGPVAAGGAPQVVSWDRVKGVEGASAVKAKPFAEIADKLWRARTRIERGDFAAAEPLLDELAQVYAAEQGPSAAVVAECLLRCRLARGAQGGATSSWLWRTWLEERRTDSTPGTKAAERPAWVGGATDLTAVVDPGTGLAPALPPVWAPVASTSAAATSPEWQRLRARGGLAAELAAAYEKSARFEAGLDTEVVLDQSVSISPGLALVRDMVLARAGDAEARMAARDALERRLALIMAKPDPTKTKVAPAPRWMEAWCRMALGRSLIRETDNSLRMRGVIQLLHLPARFADDQPFLAGIALADAAVTMAEAGDSEAAGTLKTELVARFPAHPVLAWDLLSKIASPVAPRTENRSGAMRIERDAGTTSDGWRAAASPRHDAAVIQENPSNRRDRNAVNQKGPA